MIRKPPGPTARARAKKRRKQLNTEAAIKAQVRLRDGAICRCCGIRRAESVHEIVPKSLGGKVSWENSIHVCGLLVGASPSCHTYLQKREIEVHEDLSRPITAARPLRLRPVTKAAAKWLGVLIGTDLLR